MYNSSSLRPLKWEVERFKSTFPKVSEKRSSASVGKVVGPYRLKERVELATMMTIDQILDTNVRLEDSERQRSARWKAMLSLYQTITSNAFCKISFDNAMFSHATTFIDVDYFVATIMKEYKFPNSMKMDSFLRHLYSTFDHERRNSVDWREILLHYRLLQQFRLVRDRSLDLILDLFIVYAADSPAIASSSIVDKDNLTVKNANVYLKKIFSLPFLSDSDIVTVNELAYPLADSIRRNGNKISRKGFQKLLQEEEKVEESVESGSKQSEQCEEPKKRRKEGSVVALWSRHAWERLSSEMRLTVMDEALLHHRDNAEFIIARYQHSQAMALYEKNTYRSIFRVWKLVTIKASGARAYAIKKIKRKQKRLFAFWYKYSRKKALRKRRRVLASVIGTYAIKARCFARIKLFIANYKRIEQVIGTLHRKARLFKLAGTHLREFRRLNAMKTFYHR
jgi:hypothetical protein